MKKIGLLGGSFDPPHRGHVYISIEAKKMLKLSEIWWLVTPKNPLKILKPATYQERVYNCKKITLLIIPNLDWTDRQLQDIKLMQKNNIFKKATYARIPRI